jgi:hypothetical protein
MSHVQAGEEEGQQSQRGFVVREDCHLIGLLALVVQGQPFHPSQRLDGTGA